VKKPSPFGKYYLLERINVGGMAEVFRAKAFGVEGFERLVAVKRILPNIAEDKEFIRMFIEEAKLAVQLNHANIAQIFDLGVVDGAYYIALEHVHGRDLRGMFDRCRQLGEPMPVSQACFVVMKVCEGLDYAHNKRDQAGRELHLVHRDVSPQNVLVSFEGEVKLIDFGIAKAAGKGSKTQAGILKGKFGYMSPEQVRGIPIDRRSDVFSCGIVLYELLTGERLFVGESDFSTLEKVRNVEILPPSTYNRRIPDELERIVLKALAKDPDERYANAIDLHDELQAFVYTAGEFYSRKDLAAWMKKIFGREIEEETAKLESYRQLKPPTPIEAQPAPAVGRVPTGSRPPVPTVAANTSPIRKSAQRGAVEPGGTRPPPPPPVGRLSGQMPAVPSLVSGGKPKPVRTSESGELAWDDDELETQIYDDANDDPKAKKKSGGNPVAAAGSAPIPKSAAAAAVGPASASNGPDLSSLVTTAKGWESPVAQPRPNGAPTVPPPAPSFEALVQPAASSAGTSSPKLATASASGSFGDPMASFGQGVLRKQTEHGKGKNMMVLAVGGAAAAIVAVVLIIAFTSGKGSTPAPTTDPAASNPPTPATATATPRGKPAPAPPAAVTLIVDGKREAPLGPAPAKAPLDPRKSYAVLFEKPGFISVNRPLAFTGNQQEKLAVTLEATTPTPAVADTHPATTTTTTPTAIATTSPKATTTPTPAVTTAVVTPDRHPTGPVTHPERPAVADKQPEHSTDLEKPERPAVPSKGVLLVNAKPVCDILIDGSSTGFHTPHKFDGVSVGKHTVTFVNTEFGIKETVPANVTADAPGKAIGDYSDRLPK